MSFAANSKDTKHMRVFLIVLAALAKDTRSFYFLVIHFEEISLQERNILSSTRCLNRIFFVCFLNFSHFQIDIPQKYNFFPER